jgi:hypothetical protein
MLERHEGAYIIRISEVALTAFVPSRNCVSPLAFVSGVAPRLGIIGFTRAAWVPVEPNATGLPSEESSGIIALQGYLYTKPVGVSPHHQNNYGLDAYMLAQHPLPTLHQVFTGI